MLLRLETIGLLQVSQRVTSVALTAENPRKGAPKGSVAQRVEHRTRERQLKRERRERLKDYLIVEFT